MANAPKSKSTSKKATSSTTKASTAKTSGGRKNTSTVAATSTKGKGKVAAAVPSRGRKRKSDETDEEEEEEKVPPPKKTRVTKTPKTPAVKPKVILNEASTQRLDIFVCGEGSAGELGLGTAKNAVDVKRPRLNPHLSSKSVGVVQVDCGGMHAIALTHDGTVLTWGVNDDGALGRETSWEGGLKTIDDNKSDASDDSNASDNGLNPIESTPGAVTFPEGTVIVKVAAGDSVSLALTDDGHVFGWGKFRVGLLLLQHATISC